MIPVEIKAAPSRITASDDTVDDILEALFDMDLSLQLLQNYACDLRDVVDKSKSKNMLSSELKDLFDYICLSDKQIKYMIDRIIEEHDYTKLVWLYCVNESSGSIYGMIRPLNMQYLTARQLEYIFKKLLTVDDCPQIVLAWMLYKNPTLINEHIDIEIYNKKQMFQKVKIFQKVASKYAEKFVIDDPNAIELIKNFLTQNYFVGRGYMCSCSVLKDYNFGYVYNTTLAKYEKALGITIPERFKAEDNLKECLANVHP